MIRLFNGDLFESTADIITITVNCVGVMGKGIAKTAALKYPELEKQYKRLCKEGKVKPGCPFRITIGDKQFLMFPTKDHWRNDSKIEWIDSGLAKLAENLDKFDSIALAPLGCGNGNLNFYSVFNLMLKHLEGKDCDIRVYPPK